MLDDRIENIIEKELLPDDYPQELMFEIVYAIQYAINHNADRFQLLRNIRWPNQIEDLGLWNNNRIGCEIYAPTNDWEVATNWVQNELNSKGFTKLPESNENLQQIIHNVLINRGKLYTLILESNDKNWKLINNNQIEVIDDEM